MDNLDVDSIIQVLKLIGLAIPDITEFIDTHPTMDMKDFLRAHLYQLSQHPVRWDADYDTEDLVALAHWYLANDTDDGDTFTWYTLLDVLAPACTLLVAGGSTGCQCCYRSR